MTYIKELFSLENKVIIVTGAARGLGKGIAEAVLRSGADVVMVDVAEEELKATVVEFKNQNLKAHMYCCDLGDDDQLIEIPSYCIKKFGKIDALINNAGVGFAQDFFEYSLENWDKTYNINLRAPFLLSREVARHMKRSRSGSIINVTSLNAELVFPNNPAYPAFKSGLKQLGKSMALELGKYNIRVNNVGPGYMRTKLTEPSWSNPKIFEERKNKTVLGRWGEPEDLAGIVIFLSSEASSYVTGQDFYVDGGWLIKGL